MSRIKWNIIILMLTAAMFLTACADEELKLVMLQEEDMLQEELLTAQVPNYKRISVETGEYIKTKTGTAIVAYPMRKDLAWDNSNARYQEILVTRGQAVKEGDILAVFDIEESQAEMEALQLQLKRAKENFAKGTAERLTAIEEAKEYAIYHYTYTELDIANLKIEKQQTQYEQYVYQSEREISRLEEKIEELTKEAEDNTLVAPFDGIIDYVINYNPGDQVESGKVLISMYSTDKVVLAADNTSGNLRYNMEVTLKFSYRNEEKIFNGRVISTPEMLPDGVSQDVAMIQLTDPVTEEDLKGDIIYQCHTEELQDVLVVDRDAVMKENNKDYVYILKDEAVQKRFVVTGSSNTDEVVIIDGLTAGQTLIKD